MNDMTSLLVMTVAAAFLTGALTLPATMPHAVFAGDNTFGTETMAVGIVPSTLALLGSRRPNSGVVQ